MFGPSHGQTPRSSTSSRPSELSTATTSSERPLSHIEIGESSTSTTSAEIDSHARAFTVDDNRAVATGSPGWLQEGLSRHHNGNSSKRHRPRNSGGFLLQSAFTATTGQDSSSQRAQHERNDVKGKRKSPEDGLSIAKKRSSYPRHRPKTSLGGSPLVSVVTNATIPGDEEAGQGTVESPTRFFSIQSSSNTPGSLNTAVYANREPELRLPGGHGQQSGSLAPSLSLDTDPVEIVNLALNLSESRRRNLSVNRLSTPNAAAGRRVVSMSVPSPGHQESFSVAGVGGSLRQHLQQQRRVSRNVSPLSGTGNSNRVGSASPFEVGPDRDVQYSFSDATLSRAAKARTSMELFYEYRRLLQHLPPLRSSQTTGVGHSSSAPSTSTPQPTSAETPRLGRQYNPLQYIRNRRLRARKKMPLDANVSGWDNVEGVKAWVDKVAAQSDRVIIASDENTTLPDFQLNVQDSLIEKSSPPSSLRHVGVTGPKARRPRMDWMTNPADLLADAFWLEQGTNKDLIEDKAGNKLFPSRGLTSLQRSQAAEGGIKASSEHARDEITEFEVSPLPEMQSPLAHQYTHTDSSLERGRKSHRLHGSIHSLYENSASRDRKHPREMGSIRSRTSSTASAPVEPASQRGDRQSLKDINDIDKPKSAVLEEQVQNDLESDAEESRGAPHGGTRRSQRSYIGEERGRKALASPVDHNPGRSEGTTRDKLRRLPNPISTIREIAASTPRGSLDSDMERWPGVSIDELDMTAPSSPIAPNFVPSIAINLSPPPSRSTSPSKNSLKSKLSLLRPDRSKERQLVEDTEFGLIDSLSRKSSRQASAELEMQDNENMIGRRLPSPTQKSFSRRINDSLGRDSGRSNSKLIDDKDPRESESRLRGIFKGRRIAELVGNEVSRVGDIFGKRDPAANRSLQSSPASSMASDISDSEESEPSPWGPETKLSSNVSRTTTRSEDENLLSRKVTIANHSRYHINNLPTFKSTSKGNEYKPATDPLTSDGDHITRQQAAQRERGRPSRFDRLAPPRIDIRDASPSPRGETRVGRVEATEGLNARTMGSLSLRRGVHHPHEQIDSLLGPPGSFGRRGPPVTGLTDLGVFDGDNSTQRPGLEGQRHWSISDDHDRSPVRATSNKREIAHIRALLLSSGIKAKEICRRASETREPIPPFLQNISERPLPRVPRSQEHVLAARVLIRNIELTHVALKDAKERFSSQTLNRLHDRIKSIDNGVQNKLSLLVRACADDADAFGVELTTTHTLAVKQLNDSVNQVMRKRRRRLKWIRRAGYVLLEWTLLGIMWWAWLVVVMIRLIRGGVRGVIGGVRWLLWL